MNRTFALYVVPTLLCLAGAMAPLILGTGTLYNRDVLNSHLPMKAAQAELMAEGELPLVDPYRSGGQPLMGNPNALPLYPSNVLYLAGGTLWALNAHFWLHLLLAPWAGFWLGRAWGLDRPAAWAMGVLYASSGYFLSLFNLYNLVAGAALAPAIVAACLDTWRSPGRGRGWLALGGLWALSILAGDPLTACLALGAGLAAGAVRWGGPPRRWGLSLGALALGTAVTAPQIVEMLRILPHSFRGYWRYSIEEALSQSWDPRTALEWFMPLFFGPPGLDFWGYRFYGGNPPLLYSLYPGVLALALVILAGRPRKRMAWWAWGMIALGVFLALGIWNPLLRAAHGLPGVSLLRYPVKCWLLVALGASLLGGVGFERLLEGSRRRLGWILAVLASGYLGVWALMVSAPPWWRSALRGLDPTRLGEAVLETARLQWTVQALSTVGFLALFAMALYLMRRHPLPGGAMLLALHLVGQLFFLQPLYDSDAAEFYERRPAVAEHVPEGARVVQGGSHDLFGEAKVSFERLPDVRLLWLQRTFAAELYPSSGVLHGVHYEFSHSPEGLDTFYTIALVRVLKKLDDEARLRILAATGVDRLLLDRPLDVSAQALAREIAVSRKSGRALYVYEPVGAVAPVALLGAVDAVPHMNAGLARLSDPDFDPRHRVVVLGEEGVGREGPPGRAELLADEPELLEAEVESEAGGVLLTRRAHLPIYRAAVDGESARIVIANLQRIGIEVPPGRHRVRLWVDRRPFFWTSLGALAALVALLFVGRWGLR